MIKNPKYKGPWVHPKIANPDFKEDLEIYKYKSAALFIDLWQVKSGTIFDDFIVTDSVEEAKAFAEKTFNKKKDAEAEAFKAYEAKKEAEDKAKVDIPPHGDGEDEVPPHGDGENEDVPSAKENEEDFPIAMEEEDIHDEL
jgi:calreticulin